MQIFKNMVLLFLNLTQTRVTWGKGTFSRGTVHIRLACGLVCRTFSPLMGRAQPTAGIAAYRMVVLGCTGKPAEIKQESKW